MATTKSVSLYIDDDGDDCIVLRSSLKDAGNKADLICAGNGEEAVQYLNSIPPTAFPSLIVLDLNVPRLDGCSTMTYLKSQRHLAAIPVIVLCTTENIAEKEACAQLGAVSYIKKLFHYDGYKTIAANFFTFLNFCPA
jgi:CheY-like chemotaxis protein